MNSFIITGNNLLLMEEKVQEICQKYTISSFDITAIKPDGTSLGIDDVKKMQTKAYLKPLKGDHKAIVLHNAENLTIPAQNAMLKLLEEPPANTLIFLLTNNVYDLLPTIISRVQILSVAASQHEISDDEKKEIIKRFHTWQMQTIPDALKTAEQMTKDKEKTLKTLEDSLRLGSEELRKEILSEKEGFLSTILPLLQKTYLTLKNTNANPRLTLEALFLQIINL
ncbi:MAG: hypothetical protein HZC02_01060 [Candidatus Levybacteria bacterium]|nr:hypothetical protein [Candidatus Levybacteria bacterium]